ncbi:MAG: hypothetical protein HY553_17245 [Elusimicrobia bacterium]|nr:hypothetical protein [Elusimicrobiota bacterium]
MARKAWIGAAVLALLTAACGGPQSRVKQGRVAETINQAPDRRSFVEAIGIGASDPALPTETQRKSLARDAAIVKAQFELLSMLKGVSLEGGISIQRALEVDSTLEAKLKETIKGAEIVNSEFTSDNGCVVTIRLPKHRIEDLMAVRWK